MLSFSWLQKRENKLMLEYMAEEQARLARSRSELTFWCRIIELQRFYNDCN